MPVPVESLERPALEQRYRRMRTATQILAGLAVVLVVALGAQSFQTRTDAPPASETKRSGGNAEQPSAGGESEPDASTAAQECPVVDRRDPNDPRGLGDVDAPIVLHEWTDFRCPYCGAFSRDTLPVLIEEYVSTGKVRLEIHDAALVGGENSVLIAVAARAAGEQGRYFEYYDAVYHAAAEQSESHAEFTNDELQRLAESVGVPDLEKFTADLSNEFLHDAVRAETAEAQRIGVTGVPFFATSDCGKVTSGAQPVDSFRQVLDAAIEAAEK